MKIFGRYWYVLSSPVEIPKEKRWALARGLVHLHGNPIRAKEAEQPILPLETAEKAIYS